MKKLIYSIVVVLFLTLPISCKKDAKISVAGYWSGTGTNDGSSTPPGPVSILYRGDNSASLFLLSTDTTVALKGDGTYSIDADSVRATIVISGNTVKFNGKLNSTNNQMVGRFANITNNVFGSFSWTKN